MGTLGRVCGDLGPRDARRGTWDGDAGRQIRGHGTRGRYNDYCKSRKLMQGPYLHEKYVLLGGQH